MTYTVQELADLAGISVRTLHYYDEIDLLKPSFIATNGYRHYEESEIIKLQQILFFRELEFKLNDIAKMLNSPQYDVYTALADQKQLILLKKERLDALLVTIEHTILKLKGEREMSDKEYFKNLVKENEEKYGEEVRAKYGNNAFDTTNKMSPEQLKQTLAESQRITNELVALIQSGKKPDDQAVQAVISQHFEMMGKFWDCSYDAYRSLGQMYVDDTRFTKNIDKAMPGLAVFMRDAMKLYADLSCSPAR